jgi:hypothetical protein
MKLYSSFLIRCWLIEDSQQGERVVIGVEHIQTGGHRRVASLPEAEKWMLELCRAVSSARAPETREAGRERKE